MYGDHGKAGLGPAQAASGVRFNLSHSYGWRCWRLPSIEKRGWILKSKVKPLDDGEQIAERFFSKNEVAVFTAVPTPQKPQAFFNCWTRKEAFIKVIGEGLSCPLDSFDVTLRPGEPAELLQVKGSRGRGRPLAAGKLGTGPRLCWGRHRRGAGMAVAHLAVAVIGKR
ncbi:MAG: 4'-phosphopantetheinyl transferase superfamily protein [Chloroflexota bacterium]